MENGRLLVYGAYGYTGELIVRAAVRRGCHPWSPAVWPRGGGARRRTGAGRAGFDLVDSGSVADHLNGISVVLNCAPVRGHGSPHGDGLPRHRHPLPRHHRRDCRLERYSGSPRRRGRPGWYCPGAGFDVVPTELRGGPAVAGASGCNPALPGGT